MTYAATERGAARPRDGELGPWGQRDLSRLEQLRRLVGWCLGVPDGSSDAVVEGIRRDGRTVRP